MKKYLSIILIVFVSLLTSIPVCAANTINEYESYNLSNNQYDEDEFEKDNIEFLDKESSGVQQVDTVFLENNYASYYFSQLTTYFGYNYKGTCSYVATAMLLSFYDTYWDDNIIDDSQSFEVSIPFERTMNISDFILSPGIVSEENSIKQFKNERHIAENEELSDDDYKQFILDNCEEFFHLYLLNIGTNILNKGFAMAALDIKAVLEYYLYNVREFTSDEIEVKYIQAVNLIDKKDYIIDKVNQGIPVIVCAGNINDLSSGHTYVVYDYDELEDELYCHTGWGKDDNRKNRTHVKCSSMEQSILYGLVSLEFKTEHMCSNNYEIIENGQHIKKCSCYFPCHPEHQHSFTPVAGAEEGRFHVYDCGCIAENDCPTLHIFTYTQSDGSTHTKKCTLCGYETTENHNLEYVILDDTLHREHCTECTYGKVQYHDYECTGVVDGVHTEACAGCEYSHDGLTNAVCTSIDEDNHSSVCPDCEYSVDSEPHNWVYTSINASYHEGHCSDCGASKGASETHSWRVYSDPKYVECQYCGHLKSKGGNIIIPVAPSKNDPEEETE